MNHKELERWARFHHVPRCLGRYSSNRPGPTFLALGGLHGNELAGVRAVQHVLATLESRSLPLLGSFNGLSGNRGALAVRRRFNSRDLNRRWHPAEIEALLGRDAARDVAEDREQRELTLEFRRLERESGQLVVLDLHSTSGDGAPFACMSDTLRNRELAMSLGVPVILGLEETIDGSLLGYLNDRGHITVAFEGGRHDHPETLANHVAAIWLALVSAGSLKVDEVPDFGQHRQRLLEASSRLPRVIEIRYRHAIEADSGFRMEPGFKSFQPIKAGQLLARSLQGEIRAPESGRMLMPLYQELGDDGFFVARDVKPFWLWVSKWLRRRRVDRVVRYLPGVSAHPLLDDHYLVNRRIARIYAVEIFHLLGYRRRHSESGRLLFSRRRPDVGSWARRETDGRHAGETDD